MFFGIFVVLALVSFAVAQYIESGWVPPADRGHHESADFVQGSGLGLDADLLDGHDSSDFVLAGGSVSDSEARLLATGYADVEELRSVITEDGGGSLKVINKYDERNEDQAAYVLAGSMPGTPPEGKQIRLIVRVMQLALFDGHNENDFCYLPRTHHFDEGGHEKTTCDRSWYDNGELKTTEKNPGDYFWIETSSDIITETGNKWDDKNKNCTVFINDTTNATNPYADGNIGLVCFIDVDEPVNSVAVNIADWDSGHRQWEFDIYYQYI